jgi:hypothetical protein
VLTAASIAQRASASPRWCAGIRLRCGSIKAASGFTVLRGKSVGGGDLSTEKDKAEDDHELVLHCLQRVYEEVFDRPAVQIEIVVTFADQISEFWTTNPAPLTMVRGKGSTH